MDFEFDSKNKYTGEDFKMSVTFTPDNPHDLMIKTPFITLSWTQLYILGLSATGSTNKQIEKRLKIGKDKRTSFMRDLKANNPQLQNRGDMLRTEVYADALERANLLDLETILAIRMVGIHLKGRNRLARQAA